MNIDLKRLGGGILLKAILRWWFLLVLFQCRVFLWLIKKYVFGNRIKETILLSFIVVLSVGIYLIPGHLKILPFYMNLVPICLMFLLIGYYAKSVLLTEVKMKDSILIISLLMITIIVSQLNSRVVMYSYDFGNIALFLITSLSGSMLIIRLAALLRSNYIKWVGVMCMPIYVLQFHINQYSQAVEAILLDSLGCEDIIVKITVQIAISLFVCSCLTILISKYRPLRYMFGLPN